MWKRLLTIFWRKKPPAPPRLPVEEALSDELREEAVRHAKLLFGEGVWVRELEPGEIPSDIPEIEDTPLITPAQRNRAPE